MVEILSSIIYTFGVDLLVVCTAVSTRQCVLERDLVLILWYRVQERMK